MTHVELHNVNIRWNAMLKTDKVLFDIAEGGVLTQSYQTVHDPVNRIIRAGISMCIRRNIKMFKVV